MIIKQRPLYFACAIVKQKVKYLLFSKVLHFYIVLCKVYGIVE